MDQSCNLLKHTAVAAAVLLLSACAAMPTYESAAAIQAAEQAIASAEQARVVDHAALELTAAREKLADARLAETREDWRIAQWLAEQSRVDAEYALVKSGTARAKAINDEMQKSIETLKQEMQRNSGATR